MVQKPSLVIHSKNKYQPKQSIIIPINNSQTQQTTDYKCCYLADCIFKGIFIAGIPLFLLIWSGCKFTSIITNSNVPNIIFSASTSFFLSYYGTLGYFLYQNKFKN